jgi:succinyl-diaminopimelate desuccinylase
MSDLKTAITKSIKIESLVNLISDLISIPSVNPKDYQDATKWGVSPGEGELVEFLLNRIKSKKIEVWIDYLEPGRPNLIARYPSGDCTGPILALNAHTDTISAYEMGKNAFTPKVMNGKLYGRGVADMKGALGCFVIALETIANLDVQLSGQVVLTAVIGEEGPPSGSEYLVDHGFRADGVIVGEASECHLYNGQRGGQFVCVRTFGKTGHGSVPGSGINAIEHMANLITNIPEMEIFQAKPSTFGLPTCTTGTIHGGVRTNVIPDECVATFDIRFPPGFYPDDVVNAFNNQIKKMGINGEVYPEELGYPAYVTDPNNKLVKALKQTLQSLNQTSEISLAPYWSDMAHFSNADIPSVVLGPGSILQAHSGEEYVEIRQLELATRIYMLSILNFCGAEQ